MPGRFSSLEQGDVFICICGTIKDGSKRGPRGGKAWSWLMPDGSRYCSPDCAKERGADLDDGRGDWEAAQAQAKYEGAARETDHG